MLDKVEEEGGTKYSEVFQGSYTTSRLLSPSWLNSRVQPEIVVLGQSLVYSGGGQGRKLTVDR